MKSEPALKEYDVLIIGAGPAGSTCALALEKSGLKVALVDKYNFPRDKVCGDFIPARGFRTLYAIKPELESKIQALQQKAVNHATKLFVGNQDPMQIDWVLRSFTIKRQHFDNALLEQVLEGGKIDFYPESAIQNIEVKDQHVLATTVGNQVFKAKLIIGADGAQGVTAKSLANYSVDRKHYGGSVRAYYSNVQNIDPGINEIYINKDVLPGYLWLFPLSENAANVGLGMHSKYITRHKVNLKEIFKRFLDSSPHLQNKLDDAVQEGKLKGFGLPFYSKKFTVSGARYMLCGDAASMIDPSNGEGIVTAIVSGEMAANQAVECFKTGRFDADYMNQYAKKVHGKYWKEMQMKAWFVQNFSNQPKLINAFAYCCNKSPLLKRGLQRFL